MHFPDKAYCSRLSQDQMQIFVSPEVIFQGCLSDFILCFLKSTDETVLENVYIGYNILYSGIYFYKSCRICLIKRRQIPY